MKCVYPDGNELIKEEAMAYEESIHYAVLRIGITLRMFASRVIYLIKDMVRRVVDWYKEVRELRDNSKAPSNNWWLRNTNDRIDG
ncbi:hypothetical protein BpsS140_00003 [Bacillus phage vB_BpsS-140]|nr:hypothetical protein BpsS140_00003 [Bacillus phage vB_BpsS-140]